MAKETKKIQAGSPPRIGILYRYGVVDHVELYPIIPDLLKILGAQAEVVYIGPNGEKIKGQHHWPGVRHVPIPFKVSRASFREKMVKALVWYLWLPFIALYCRWQRLDVIWIDESSLPMQARIVQLLSGCRVVQTVTDFFVDIYKEHSLILRVLAGFMARVDRRSWEKSPGIFTRTDAMRAHLLESGIHGDIRTVRDAVLPDLFTPVDARDLRKRLGFSDADVVLCHHGILHPNKGIPFLIEQLLDFFPAHPQLKLLIVGDGPDRNIIEALVCTHGLEDRVIMTGWLSGHEEVNRHLSAADIGLVMRLASFYDHFHVTGACVHCMMAQLPVLSVNLAGVMEIIRDGVEGYIFDPADRTSLYRSLEKLIGDPESRRRMGIQGRQKALAIFNSARIAAQTAECLLQWSRRPPCGVRSARATLDS